MAKKFDKRRILVAPLDWGLGHATRCIPIISQLLKAGHDVYIAAEGKTKALLEQEFPAVQFLVLRGYKVNYGRHEWGLMVNIFFQIPKILAAIKKENRWLKDAVDKYGFDVVISDNRYGLHHPKIHSVFITHQLIIKSPIFQKRLQKINYSYINKFDECWIPDYDSTPSLAGDLSHPDLKPQTLVKYIGPLSRFKFESQESNKHLLVLLSGPEPQRTLLEEKILAQLKSFQQPVVLVRGLPGNASLPAARGLVTIVNHLPGKELNVLINEANLVIARAGYSTIMDLMALQKKSILIPTPGQTEQEYLADYLMKNGLAFCVAQKDFDLEKAIDSSNEFDYKTFPKPRADLLQKCVEGLFKREQLHLQ